jgi:hypothetical protein
MDDSNSRADRNEQADGQRHGAGPDRRRRALLRLGTTAAPVLLTIHSNPVSATLSSSCVKASGFISAATFKSRNPHSNYIQCTGNGLTFWRSECGLGTMSTYKATLDQTVGLFLYGSGYTASTYNDRTVRSVITENPASTPLIAVLQRVLAMSLSVQFSMAPVGGDFTKAYLRGVWEDLLNGGTYNPVGSGMNWDATTTATWLDRLMTPNMPLA